MKFLLFFVLIAAMASVALSRSGFWGKRQPKDSLVFTKTVRVFPKRGKIATRNISHDPVFSRRNITAIVVNDNFRNNSGADPMLLRGGVNKTYVDIRLTGQRSMGINSTILIYAKK